MPDVSVDDTATMVELEADPQGGPETAAKPGTQAPGAAAEEDAGPGASAETTTPEPPTAETTGSRAGQGGPC